MYKYKYAFVTLQKGQTVDRVYQHDGARRKQRALWSVLFVSVYSGLCRPNAEDTACSRLHSAARGDLQVPRSKTNFGSRAFAACSPRYTTI